LDGSVEDYMGVGKDEEDNMKIHVNLGAELLIENIQNEEK
jgi:hypothetical protein